jgi:hypothetical protein
VPLISGTPVVTRRTLLHPRDRDAAASRRVRVNRRSNIWDLADLAAELRVKFVEKEKFIGFCFGPCYCRITPYDTLLKKA